MKFGSVCSGIEAASVAWKSLGWEAAWFSEIEPFPCAVLAHHYPSVPNYGDMTLLPNKILSEEISAPDIFCGGTPCQAFSVAGLRRSLEDDRGNLSLTFCEIANAIDSVRFVRGEPPCIFFWENVPGVLNTPDNAFGCFLAGLAGEDDPLIPSGKKWTNAGCVFGPKRAVAWRVTDAQYFGVAQRRRRVFVVASARDGFDPTKVLFEFNGLRRDIAPSREKGQAASGRPLPSIANCLTSRMHKGINSTVDEGQTPILEPVGVPEVMATLLSATAGISRPGNASTEHETYIPLAYSVREDAIADNFSATPPEVSTAVTALRPSPQSHHAQVFVAQPITFSSVQSNQPINKNLPVSQTLEAKNQMAVLCPIPFDTTQITNPLNYSHPKSGDPCHPLAAEAHPPAVAQPITQYEDIAGSLTARHDSSPCADRSQNMVAQPVAYSFDSLASNSMKSSNPHSGCRAVDLSKTLDTTTPEPSKNQGGIAVMQPIVAPSLTASNDPSRSPQSSEVTQQVAAVHAATMAVRRLTPRECERLQGFPDGYTNIPWRGKPEAPDGPRYKALGNSWAVPNVRWIGERIARELSK